MTLTYNEADAQKIIAFWKAKGYNNYAICAWLGNWYPESGLRSNNAQNSYMKKYGLTDEEYTLRVDNGTWATPDTNKPFSRDAIGYGLAQWTSAGRKDGLLKYVQSKQKSISDIQSQLEYAYKELTSGSYKATIEALKSATEVRTPTIAIMVNYERPASSKNPDAQNKRVEIAEEFYDRYFQNKTSSNYIMSANNFIAKLWDIARNYKTLYVLGTWGWIANDKNKNRAITKQSYNATAARKAKIQAATPDYFFFDCAGLIKGILWGWNGDHSKTYGGAGYAVNGVPDTSAMINYCTDVSTSFDSIVPGELLYLPGHVGVYVGEGKVIECTPIWEDSVQVSWLGNIGFTTGHYRNWEKHGKLQWIDYSGVLEELQIGDNHAKPTNEDIYNAPQTLYTVVKGDTLTKIAKRFSTTVEKLVELNGIEDPNKIYAGQVLIVKGTKTDNKTSYTVQPGDTLSSIAKRFNTTYMALAVKNHIVNPNKIVVGQVLKL